MTNAEIQAIYNSNIGVSHVAGLRAVFDAGWNANAGITPNATTPDQSASASAPSANVVIPPT